MMLPIAQVWAFYPALLYGIAMVIGVGFALSGSWWLGVPAAMVIIPLCRSRIHLGRLALCLLAGASGYAIALTHYELPKLPLKGVAGHAQLDIHAISVSSHHFGQSWQYKGTLIAFKGEDGSHLGRNIPVTLHLPYKAEFTHPPATCSYVVEGRLKRTKRGNYALAVHPGTPWFPIEKTWSLAEMRYHAKQAVKHYIHAQIDSQRGAKFLTGLATGEFDDRMMAFEFSRFGLQHLMAISGFHFGIIACFLSLTARLLLPRRWIPWTLLAGLTAYFIFLGASPSVMRSWISAVVLFGSQLVERESSGLNSLGLGLLGILAFDPLACMQLGFQFSFATTAAILLFHSPSLQLVEGLWPKRTVSEMICMNALNQHAYLLLSFIKQSVALTMAVSIVALPMTFFYFHQFPLLSLLYNLFFPFMVSIAMLLLMLGMMLAWVPPLSALIHRANTAYTDFALNFTYSIPTHYDIVFYYEGLTAEFLIVYLAALFCWGLSLKSCPQDNDGWQFPVP